MMNNFSTIIIELHKKIADQMHVFFSSMFKHYVA